MCKFSCFTSASHLGDLNNRSDDQTKCVKEHKHITSRAINVVQKEHATLNSINKPAPIPDQYEAAGPNPSNFREQCAASKCPMLAESRCATCNHSYCDECLAITSVHVGACAVSTELKHQGRGNGNVPRDDQLLQNTSVSNPKQGSKRKLPSCSTGKEVENQIQREKEIRMKEKHEAAKTLAGAKENKQEEVTKQTEEKKEDTRQTDAKREKKQEVKSQIVKSSASVDKTMEEKKIKPKTAYAHIVAKASAAAHNKPLTCVELPTARLFLHRSHPTAPPVFYTIPTSSKSITEEDGQCLRLYERLALDSYDTTLLPYTDVLEAVKNGCTES